MNKDRLSSSFNSDKARAAFTKKGGKVADVSAKSKALGKKNKVRDFAYYERQDKKWSNKAK